MTGPDEYESVLGLPLGPRPPNHYELLGLELFESNESVIAAAADRALRRGRGVGAGLRRSHPPGDLRDSARPDLPAQHRGQGRLRSRAKANRSRRSHRSSPSDRPSTPAHSTDVPATAAIRTVAHRLDRAGRPRPGKSRKFRVWFWAFTLIEGLCVLGLLLYLRPRTMTCRCPYVRSQPR